MLHVAIRNRESDEGVAVVESAKISIAPVYAGSSNCADSYRIEIINTDTEGDPELCSFNITTPLGYHLTRDNLVEFLCFMISTSNETKNLRNTYTTKFKPRQVEISIASSLGMMGVRISQPGRTRPVLLFNDKMDDSRYHQITVPSILIEKNPSSPDKKYKMSRISSRNNGLTFSIQNQDGETTLGRIYLKERMSLQEEIDLRFNGKHYPLNKDRYADCEDDLSMVWKSIGEFDYLETKDEKFVLCIGSNTPMKAVSEILRMYPLEKLADFQKTMMNYFTHHRASSLNKLLFDLCRETHARLSAA